MIMLLLIIMIMMMMMMIMLLLLMMICRFESSVGAVLMYRIWMATAATCLSPSVWRERRRSRSTSLSGGDRVGGSILMKHIVRSYN